MLDIDKKLARDILQQMKIRKLSQKALAQQIGLKPADLNQNFTGRRRFITRRLERVLDELGLVLKVTSRKEE